jgi:uncharacterized protein (TIGR03437 family)
MHRILAVLLAVPALAQQQVVVYSPYIGDGPASPGSLAAVDLYGPPLDSVASHYRIEVGGKAARILSGNGTRLEFVVPADIPLGTAMVEVSIGEVRYKPVGLEIVHAAPALITVAENRLTHPAVPGDFVTLWASGLGDLTPSTLKVDVAGQLVPPSYAGPAPEWAGVDQVNFEIPRDARRGCYVPVSLRGPDVVSNRLYLAVSDSREGCSHPLGLSTDQLTLLDARKTIRAGIVQMNAFGSEVPMFVRGSFGSTAADEFETLAWLQASEGCQLDLFIVPTMAVRVGDFSIVPPYRPNAPGSLTFSGPEGQSLVAKAVSSASVDPVTYSTSVNLQGAPGAWTAALSGSAAASPFEFGFELPPQIRWSNREALSTIAVDQDVRVTWDASGYGSAHLMRIGFWTADKGRSVGISCAVPAQTGLVVIPQALVRQVAQPGQQFNLSLVVGPREPLLFPVPFPDGSSGPGWFVYSLAEIAVATIR